jgi:hypothetical protein
MPLSITGFAVSAYETSILPFFPLKTPGIPLSCVSFSVILIAFIMANMHALHERPPFSAFEGLTPAISNSVEVGYKID